MELYVYEFIGSDSSSDEGYFKVIIVASTLKKAQNYFKNHLRETGYSHLSDFSNVRVNSSKLPINGIIYSQLSGQLSK